MGVDLIDCVKAQWPEHAEHMVSLLCSFAARSFAMSARTDDVPWECSCGAVGSLTYDQVGELLRASKVTTF